MMKLKSIKTYAREAYMNRYAFDRVQIDKDGRITGHFDARNGRPAVDPIRLGSIHDCSTSINPRKTGLCFYNRDHLVYTFAVPE